MTYQLTVLYHRPEDPAAFDDYYASTHAPLAARLPGLSSYTSVRPGHDPAGNDPQEYLVATLVFPDEQAFHDAMASPEGGPRPSTCATSPAGGRDADRRGHVVRLSRPGRGRAQKWVQPVGPSYAAPSTVTPGPSSRGRRPSRRPASPRAPTPVGVGREQRVVVAAAEDELQRVGAQRGADRLQRLGDLEGAAAHVDRHARGLRDVAGVGEQAVGDVDHRGRAGVGGHPARVVRRLRAAVGLHQHPRRAEAPAQHREASGGPALATERGRARRRARRRSGRPGPSCRRRSR